MPKWGIGGRNGGNMDNKGGDMRNGMEMCVRGI